MISRDQLRRIGGSTGLNLYQQEKDYALKLFLYNYYGLFEDAVFKGGTCIKYLFGTRRFSEDLDFNLLVQPSEFRAEVKRTLKAMELIGLVSGFIRDETFEDSYTCEIWFHGPLYDGKEQNRNRFRIDAGKRTGLEREPQWRFMASEYPETREKFLVCMMHEEEILVEKMLALQERRKGRDLYDVWFLLESGMRFDLALYKKKAKDTERKGMVSREEYERDMRKLTNILPPYVQLKTKVEAVLKTL